MTGDELFVEADGWLVLLKEAAKKVYDTKIAIQDKNVQIDALSAKDNNQTAAEEREGIQQKISALTEEKSVLLDELTKLRAERKTMVARLDAVLDNINDKIGTDAAGKELEKVLPYRRYIDTVSGISLEVTDAHSAWKTVTGWVMSDEGGMYWLINIAKFLAILFIAMFISKLLSKGARRALEHTPSNSQLLNDFIANIIHKVVMLIGLLVALAAFETVGRPERNMRFVVVIEQELRQGRQAYVVYPLVEESEKSDLQAATVAAETFATEIFPEFKIGLLHGRMKTVEKDAVMNSFRQGDIQTD
jgi:hypothetical protein